MVFKLIQENNKEKKIYKQKYIFILKLNVKRKTKIKHQKKHNLLKKRNDNC